MSDRCLSDEFFILVCYLLFFFGEEYKKKKETHYLTTFLKNVLNERSDISFLNQLPNYLVDFIVFNTSLNKYKQPNNFYCRYKSEIKKIIKDNMIQYFEKFSKPKEKKKKNKFENNYFIKKFFYLKL